MSETNTRSGASDRGECAAAHTASRQEQMEAVAEIVAAGATLLLDWAQGSVQRTRTTNCGDERCDYASCRLADAMIAYVRLADKEPV